MARGDRSELLGVVDRRADLLRALGRTPTPKNELEDDLDVSRSTIDRGIRELEERALVERDNGGYRRTLSGRLALREYERFHERIRGLRESGNLLAAVDANADFDAAMLAGATVVEQARTTPHRPIEELYGIVKSATEVRAFAPVVHSQQIDTYRTKISDGMEAELVLTGEVIERLLAEHAEAFEDTVDSERVGLWEAADDLPYSLALAETPDGPRAVVMVYDDRGVLGCIHNDDPAAVEWARERYERERRRATRIA